MFDRLATIRSSIDADDIGHLVLAQPDRRNSPGFDFSRELRDIPRIAGMHHEKLDGSGYPFGLRGDEIPLEGRILAVADIFQALTQTRPYKQGMAVPEALSELRVMTRAHRDRYDNESGMHVDPLVVEALARILARENDDLGIFDEASKWERMLQGQII